MLFGTAASPRNAAAQGDGGSARVGGSRCRRTRAGRSPAASRHKGEAETQIAAGAARMSSGGGAHSDVAARVAIPKVAMHMWRRVTQGGLQVQAERRPAACGTRSGDIRACRWREHRVGRHSIMPTSRLRGNAQRTSQMWPRRIHRKCSTEQSIFARCAITRGRPGRASLPSCSPLRFLSLLP